MQPLSVRKVCSEATLSTESLLTWLGITPSKHFSLLPIMVTTERMVMKVMEYTVKTVMGYTVTTAKIAIVQIMDTRITANTTDHYLKKPCVFNKLIFT